MGPMTSDNDILNDDDKEYWEMKEKENRPRMSYEDTPRDLSGSPIVQDVLNMAKNRQKRREREEARKKLVKTMEALLAIDSNELDDPDVDNVINLYRVAKCAKFLADWRK